MKNITVFFLFAWLSIMGTSEHCSKSSYEQVYKVCMNVWTQLDLLSAIRISQEDLQYFGNELIDQLLALHYHSIEINGNTILQAQERSYLYSIMHQIYLRFEEIFASGYSKEIFCAQVLLERILLLLEEPF